jgi:hypothetical protein
VSTNLHNNRVDESIMCALCEGCEHFPLSGPLGWSFSLSDENRRMTRDWFFLSVVIVVVRVIVLLKMKHEVLVTKMFRDGVFVTKISEH